MQLKSTVSGFMAATGAALLSGAAFAQQAGDGITGLDVIGAPVDGAMGFQPAATNIARDLFGLDYMVLVITSVVVVFVTLLLLYVIVRYNQRVNKTPASFTHHSPVEVAWTLIPIVILVFIGAFSLPVLFNQQEIPEGDIHIKATGYQWYWGYEYIGEGFGFDSYGIGHPATLSDADIDAGAVPFVLSDAMEARLIAAGYSRDEWLLAVDNAVVIPSGKDIVVRVTGADVIHAWAIPAFGVKQDAVPGRTAELWFNVDVGNEGIYFGQCSELCGKDHSYMPITVKVVTLEQYEAWLDRAREEFAGLVLPAAEQAIVVASAD